MNTIKKIAVFLLVILLNHYSTFADSYTFQTGISGISGGVKDFGFNLFPLGTNWSYSKSLQLHPDLEYSAYFSINMGFSLQNNYMSNNYSWKDGSPIWNKRFNEVDWSQYLWKTYFNPKANMSFYLSQGFGTNRYSGYGPLASISISLNSRYSMALERIDIEPNNEDLIFTNEKGDAIAPFGPKSKIPGFPWLQDSRILLNNDCKLAVDFYHNKSTGYGTSDGLYGQLYAEFGPHWLGNNITIAGTTSNYWKLGASLVESMTLLNISRENGMNWISLGLSHGNDLSYTGGRVVPEHKIPGDRLRGYFADTISISLFGPQFIAFDCNMSFSLSLSNAFYFGKVVNEISNTSKAIELQSSISGYYHCSLFGFLNLGWNFGYYFANGFWASQPNWVQSADVYFYVSL